MESIPNEIILRFIAFLSSSDVWKLTSTCHNLRCILLPEVLRLVRLNSVSGALKFLDTFQDYNENNENVIFSHARRLHIRLPSIHKHSNLLASMLSLTGPNLLSISFQSIEPSSSEHTVIPFSLLRSRRHMRQIWISDLVLDSDSIVEFGALVRQNSELFELFLVDCELSHIDAELLGNALRDHRSLSSLMLWGNPIGRGIESICNAFDNKSALQTLDLSSTSLLEDDIAILSSWLGSNKTVETLYLSHLEITDNGARYLGESLRTNSVLKTLEMNSSIGDEVVHIFNGLRENQALVSLNISENEIGTDTGSFIANCLLVNKVLRELKMNGNYSATDCIAIFAPSLASNKTLQLLDLRFISMTTNTCDSLSKALKMNCSLQSLNLSSTSLNDESMNLISKSITECRSLSFIDFSKQSFSFDTFENLCRCLTHSNIQKLILCEVEMCNTRLITFFKTICTNDSKLEYLDLKKNKFDGLGVWTITDVNVGLIHCIDYLLINKQYGQFHVLHQ
ncbi:NACHT, LRR and PYD domains-containing protein 8, partial [Nowakowskiella sp. JEL0078]